MVPESGKLFPAYSSGYYDDLPGENQYQPDGHYLDDHERGPRLRSRASNLEPVGTDNSYVSKNLSLPRSVRSPRSIYDGAYDDNDDNRFLRPEYDRSFQPQDRYADVSSPTGMQYQPDNDRSSRGMSYIRPAEESVGDRSRSRPDRSRSPLLSRSPVRSPREQVRPVPLPPRPPPPRPWPEADDDEEVFMPPPISSILPAVDHHGLPRHSSMKPGAQQTYLTDDSWGEGPFGVSDLSSVLPSPSFDSRRPPYQPYQREYENFPFRQVPTDSDAMLPPYNTSDASYNNTVNDTVIPREASTIRQDSNSSNSSGGRPLNYTRDRLLGAVDRVRKGPRTSRKGSGLRGSGSELDNITESPVQPGFYSKGPHDDERPSLRVLDRPSKDSAIDSSGGMPGMDSRGSMSSSGLGSDARFRNPGLDSRSYDMTPDSVSSGIGTGNTSSQLTGSSLHSRPSRTGSHPTPQEYSLDSGHNDLPPVRKDISADENYEFDSVTAAESDLLEALRNYSEVNNGGNDDLLSALQDGLNSSGFLQDLYPKPRRQSRYSDSEQRFEKLRGEFQQYRQKQQERHSGSSRGDRSYSSGNGDMSYGSGTGDRSQGSGNLGYQPRGSNSSSHSSRASYPRVHDSGYGDRSQGRGQFGGYQPRRSDSSSHSSRGSGHRGYAPGPGFYTDNYKQGPMDSDML